jgi:invasion protein IalB
MVRILLCLLCLAGVLACQPAVAEDGPSIFGPAATGSPGPAEPKVTTAVVSPAPPGKDDPPVRSRHGAWQMRCQPAPKAGKEQCALMQSVVAKAPANVALTAIIVKRSGGQGSLMRILAPSGILLPSGLGLQIDGNDLGRAGFVRCLANGCIAEVILDDSLLKSLETGKTATFIIFQTPEEGFGIPIVLAGLKEGFDKLP